MKTAALLLLWFAAAASAGLDRYEKIVMADAVDSAVPEKGVRITYLGTNGYLLQSKGATLLVDPYFTRAPLWPIALNLRLESSEEDVRWGSERLPPRVDAIFITHGHFDHLLDAPPIARATGARIIASRTGAFLARAAGAPRASAVRPGMTIPVAAASVRVLEASHDCVFGRIPFPGTRDAVPHKPARPSDWVCGEPLAFVIEMGGKRIYLDSGGTPSVLPPREVGPVDLAIVGVALPDSRGRLIEALARVRPRFFLPTHQDHFFRPVQRGFIFGPMTDFPEVRRLAANQRLILLDYFRPWTLR